jgi:UDP-N-acetylmuramate: L-alanyl-gamma-D-glutamyl-meso-diaminopimelate ligase
MQDLENILKKEGAGIYFVGIGGIAMSAAANIAKQFGYKVCGSDSKELYDPAKFVLDENQIKYFTGYSRENLRKFPINLYVLSAGEGLNNPEVKAILERDLPRTSFPEIMFEFSKDNLRIVVAGTHGKTTTAGLMGHLVKNLDDGSFLVGGVLKNYNSNFYKGSGHYFVFEGDEYKSQFDDTTPKFIYYRPDILVLTNLEYDHPDMFGSFEDMEKEFRELISQMPEDGLIIYNADDSHLSKLVFESNVASASFAIENQADFEVKDVNNGPEFTDITVNNKFSKDLMKQLLSGGEHYKIQLPGQINVYNSLAAIATLRALGFSEQQVALELAAYSGIKRRFEIVGVKNGIIIIDDYAHHPTAVKRTLETARSKYPNSKIWAIFEPHTFSRTKATLSELSLSFEKADEVLISEIYPARESVKNASINSDEVVAEIKSKIANSGTKIKKVINKDDALNIIKNESKPGDVIIVMAVGNFNRLAYELKEIL